MSSSQQYVQTPSAQTPSASLPTTDSSAGETKRGKSKKPLLIFLVVAALVAIYFLVSSHVEKTGWEFFNRGKTVVQTLEGLAKTVESGNLAALENYYRSDYSGKVLGFNQQDLSDDRDGVNIYNFRSSGESADRQGAIAEWREYYEGFEEVEEVGMFIHRLEAWEDPADVVASVRFEVIGTPTGGVRSGIDRGFIRMHFDTTSEQPQVFSAELIEGDRVISQKAHFVDIGPEAGIDFENQYYPRFLSEPLKFAMLKYGPAGITAADYDNDGFYDLFIPDGVESRLFRNLRDGTFEDVTEAAGLSGQDGTSVALFADYDNDGFKDIFISRTFTTNRLFRNNGDGTFTDKTAESGIGEDCCTTVASWGDYNNDGLLDLYVGRYLDPRLAIPTTFYARNGEPNQLYRNNGDGTFDNVTEETGVGELGLCLGSVFGDYDNDGDADLYVVNDFGRKTLYRNDGPDSNYTYTDVTVETGTLAYGAGMSASFGDYDNDGMLDIYIAHIRSEEGWFAESPTVFRYMFNSWRQGVWMTDMPLYFEIFKQSGFEFVKVFQDMASGNTLLRNKGDGTFEDTTWQASANPPGWFWGSGFADFDNDGWQDIYSANGWVYNEKDTEIELSFLNNVVSEQKEYKTGSFFNPANFDNKSWHGWERNRHLRSNGVDENGNVTFKEIGRATDTDLLVNSRGTAVADFWNRGVLDIAVAASTDRHVLLRNDVGTERDWFAVELIGAAGEMEEGSNRDAVGARVSIRTGESVQMREVALGDGYGSQNTLRLYFGLGSDRDADSMPMVDEMVVTWPRSGIVQRFDNVAANRIVEVKENREDLVEKIYESLYEPPSFDAPLEDVEGDLADTESADQATNGEMAGGA